MISVRRKISYDVYSLCDMIFKNKSYNDLGNHIMLRLDDRITSDIYDNIWDEVHMTEKNMRNKNG